MANPKYVFAISSLVIVPPPSHLLLSHFIDNITNLINELFPATKLHWAPPHNVHFAIDSRILRLRIRQLHHLEQSREEAQSRQPHHEAGRGIDVLGVKIQRHLRRDAVVPNRVVLLNQFLRRGGDAREGRHGGATPTEGHGR